LTSEPVRLEHVSFRERLLELERALSPPDDCPTISHPFFIISSLEYPTMVCGNTEDFQVRTPASTVPKNSIMLPPPPLYSSSFVDDLPENELDRLFIPDCLNTAQPSSTFLWPKFSNSGRVLRDAMNQMASQRKTRLEISFPDYAEESVCGDKKRKANENSFGTEQPMKSTDLSSSTEPKRQRLQARRNSKAALCA
jgi:hypothetical protein